MATYTENYNLKMPSGQDAPDVEDFNTNAEIIDTVLKAHSDNTADEYSPDETYTAGRLVIQNNALWKAKQDINVAEAWTPEHWELTTLAAELSAVNSSLSVKSEEIVIGVWLDQNGHEATLRFRLGEHSFAPNQWNTICTLPEGVRPVGPINFVLYDNLLNNNEEQRPILCEISGENVNIYAFADKTTMAPYGSGTFIFENRDPET